MPGSTAAAAKGAGISLQDYLGCAPDAPLRAVFVGKDPFPTSATAIAFCKPSWGEQWQGSSSGRHVLLSLGVPDDAPLPWATPSDLFAALARRGIVFLNASYTFVGAGQPLRRWRDQGHLLQAHAINRPVLERAQAIFFLGEGRKVRWVAPHVQGECLVHPATRNRYARSTQRRWAETWSPGALQQRLQLDIGELLADGWQAHAQG